MLAPTLIVGLGGTGSRIVANVQKKATEVQRKNIGFVVLDTDANELRVLQEKGFTGTFIQTSSKLTVGEYLNIDRDARDNWFPVNEILNRKTVSEGAGQIRAISRLAMNTTIRSGALDGLHKAIDNLYRLTGDDMKQALRVIIVSTLAGGTGSGILLPLAMYIRNYLVSRYQQNASIMRGFFLLPEIFFDVITTRSEQNNLMCNAYATLRELDAFLMKGDGTLPAQYKPALQMPNPGMEGSTEYDVMPFDFCFLFDAQNMDGSKLNSLGDYLEHAANCIYSQSVSPMQARSYSSEDNVIRELCKDGGRNRYCGAGTSMLIYPFDDVREYVALNWAKTGTSKDWIAIDEQYKAEQAEYKKALSQGANLPKTEKDRHYIQNIHTSVTEKNPFALYIKNQCYEMGENGIVTDIPKWESYISALEGFVSKNATEGQTRENTAEMDSEPDSAIEAEKGANQTDVFMNILQKLRTYNKLAVKATEESARSIAYTLFYSDMGLKSGKEEHKLEYWLKNETGEMIHPNSARFFLYNLLPILKENRNMYHNAVQRAETSWNSFENGFDDPNTENIIESAETRIHKDIRKGSNAIALYLNNDKREEILEKFRAFHSTTKDYRVKAVLSEVYSTAIVYVQSLIESYEHFFVALAQNVKKLDGRIEQIYRKYNQSKGIATRYVCANSQCLDAMEHQLMYPGNAFDVPGRLCTGIYQQVKEQVMSTKKGIKVGNNYYDELFNTVIIGYWKDAVMSYYGSNVDMDVVQALYKEAEIMADAVTPQAQQRYMLDVMDECRRLSRPFIESPRGEQPREIPTCTFHKSVRESVPTQLQGRVFLNGVDNEDIAKSMMIFYSAIYGIRANQLSKFSPPVREETENRHMGEYYQTYFELVNRLDPDLSKSKVITPHIDKRWHIITELPDLDERNQLNIEYTITKALLLGLVFDYIEYLPKSALSDVFCYKMKNSASRTTELVVSNGTDCDDFYELVDAITINPVAVQELNALIDCCIQKDLDKKCEFSQSRLKRELDSFVLPQFSEGVRSFLELPLLYKYSVPVPDYDEDRVLNMICQMMEIIKEYVKKYASPADVEFIYADFLWQQYELFEKNLRELSALKDYQDIIRDPVANEIRNLSANFFDSVDNEVNIKRVESIKKTINQLRVV